jgi:hypothetical protein
VVYFMSVKDDICFSSLQGILKFLSGVINTSIGSLWPLYYQISPLRG